MKLKPLVNWLPVFAIALLLGWHYTRYNPQSRPSQPRTSSDAYTVLSVPDGDTIRATSINTGKKVNIRFACIDAPEVTHGKKIGQPFGDESKANLKKWIDAAGGQIIVQQVDTDRFGRVVGEVFIKHPKPTQPGEELFLNAQQVQDGLAYAYDRYAKNCSQFDIVKSVETEAKSNKVGVWSGSYERPWDFRKSQR
jgi:endonuclease YncB( thermonuclease family)